MRKAGPLLALAVVAVLLLVAVAAVAIDDGTDQEVTIHEADEDGTTTTAAPPRLRMSTTTTATSAVTLTTTTALTATTSTTETPTTLAPSTTRPSPRSPDDTAPLEVQVTTDRTDYEPSQPVAITVTSCNRRSTVYRENHPLPHARMRILNERGESVADDDGVVYPAVMTSSEWQPGECKVGRREWAQNSGPLSPGESDSRPAGERVPPGQYRVELIWNGYEGDSPRDPKPVYNSEPFQIV